jgi:hypothetical protein
MPVIEVAVSKIHESYSSLGMQDMDSEVNDQEKVQWAAGKLGDRPCHKPTPRVAEAGLQPDIIFS